MQFIQTKYVATRLRIIDLKIVEIKMSNVLFSIIPISRINQILSLEKIMLISDITENQKETTNYHNCPTMSHLKYANYLQSFTYPITYSA